MIHKRVRHPARANIACLQWILTVFPDLDEIPQLPPAPLLRAEIAGSRICWEQKLLSPALAPAELDSSFCWESVKANAMAVKTAGMHSSSPRPLLSDRSECCSLPILSPGWVGSSLHVVVSRATLSWCPHSDMHQTKYQTHEIQSAKKKKKNQSEILQCCRVGVKSGILIKTHCKKQRGRQALAQQQGGGSLSATSSPALRGYSWVSHTRTGCDSPWPHQGLEQSRVRGRLLEKQLCHSAGYKMAGSDEKIHQVPSCTELLHQAVLCTISSGVC